MTRNVPSGGPASGSVVVVLAVVVVTVGGGGGPVGVVVVVTVVVTGGGAGCSRRASNAMRRLFRPITTVPLRTSQLASKRARRRIRPCAARQADHRARSSLPAGVALTRKLAHPQPPVTATWAP